MVRNILAIVAGLVIGSIVNGFLVTVGPVVIPPPAGTDLTTVEGITAAMPLMKPINFLVPFAAHALGTLVGAMVAALIAVGSRMKFALAIGVLFLIGGIIASWMIPAPTWFVALDLIFAYIPMAWIGAKLGKA